MKKWFTVPNMIILAVAALAVAVIFCMLFDPFKTITPTELPEQWELYTVTDVDVGEDEVGFQVTRPEGIRHNLKMDLDRYTNYRFGEGQLIFIMADQQTVAGYRYKLVANQPHHSPVETIAPEPGSPP